MKETKFFSYKMADDTGFAPNPFQGFLTLANCKPCFRQSKKIGDWIAGFTSKRLNNEKIGEEKLIYLMKVTNKVTYEEYWNTPEFECKKPKLDSVNVEDKAGDNIYKPNNEHTGGFEQIANKNHFYYDKEHDLTGKNVLISDHFYYFGGKPITIPDEFRPKIPNGQSAHGSRTYDENKILQLIDYIESKYPMGVINMPLKWPKDKNGDNEKDI